MELNRLEKSLNGVYVVQITPFNRDGSLDIEGMRANTRWLARRTAGKDFVFVPMGSNGEFYAVSENEWTAVIKMVVEEVGGRNVVIAGAGMPGTDETIRRCRLAESVGADGALVVLPYYLVPEEEGMYQHYRKIAEAVNSDFGIVLYNFAAVSGSWVQPPLMARLAQIPNFVAVKENTTSIISFRMMQKALETTGTLIICGRGEEIVPYVARFGCTSFTSFLANFVPEYSYDVYQAAVAADYERLDELCWRSSPFFKNPEIVRCMPAGSSFTAKVTAHHGPNTGVTGQGGSMQSGILKAAMDMLGLRGGEVRLPLVGLDEDEKAELREILQRMGLKN